MKTLSRNTLPTLLVLLALNVSSVQAQGNDDASEPQALVALAENLTATAEAAEGRPRTDDIIRGDDVVRFRLVFTNVTEQPVRNVVLNNPVPAGFQMIAGSAQASQESVRQEFSADGGQTFSAQPMEEVLVDGAPVRRPIAPDRYTHVRWTVEEWVAPQATVTADFDVRQGNALPPTIDR